MSQTYLYIGTYYIILYTPGAKIHVQIEAGLKLLQSVWRAKTLNRHYISSVYDQDFDHTYTRARRHDDIPPYIIYCVYNMYTSTIFSPIYAHDIECTLSIIKGYAFIYVVKTPKYI